MFKIVGHLTLNFKVSMTSDLCKNMGNSKSFWKNKVTYECHSSLAFKIIPVILNPTSLVTNQLQLLVKIDKKSMIHDNCLETKKSKVKSLIKQ